MKPILHHVDGAGNIFIIYFFIWRIFNFFFHQLYNIIIRYWWGDSSGENDNVFRESGYSRKSEYLTRVELEEKDDTLGQF